MLAAIAASAGGCVIPIAPEFEQERNVPPFVRLADPPEGTMVTDGNQVFRAVVEDPNRADNLHVVWLIDYPPYVDNISRSTRPSEVASKSPSQPNEHPLNFKPECDFDNISPSITEHRLMLLVSDRPFPMMPADGGTVVYDRIAPGAHALRVVWSFVKVCPQ